MITFEPIDEIDYKHIDRYAIQGFIYSTLKFTSLFSDLHDTDGFKFFNFSNIFPISKFERNYLKKLLISSPNEKLIKSLYKILRNKPFFHLKGYKMELLKVKILKNRYYNSFKTATPIVLFEDNQNNKYYSFNHDSDFNFFFNRLKDNALKKYNAFKDDDFYFEDPIFDNIRFKREVSVRLNKNGNNFIIIGSLWDFLSFNFNKETKEFFNFIYDCGLGEKNSLGFGFLNFSGR